MVVAAVYILYLLFLIVRACSELRHMPYVGKCPITNCPRPGELGAGRTAGLLFGSPPSKGLTWMGPVPLPLAGDKRLRSLRSHSRAEWATLGLLDSALGPALGGL